MRPIFAIPSCCLLSMTLISCSSGDSDSDPTTYLPASSMDSAENTLAQQAMSALDVSIGMVNSNFEVLLNGDVDKLTAQLLTIDAETLDSDSDSTDDVSVSGVGTIAVDPNSDEDQGAASFDYQLQGDQIADAVFTGTIGEVTNNSGSDVTVNAGIETAWIGEGGHGNYSIYCYPHDIELTWNDGNPGTIVFDGRIAMIASNILLDNADAILTSNYTGSAEISMSGTAIIDGIGIPFALSGEGAFTYDGSSFSLSSTVSYTMRIAGIVYGPFTRSALAASPSAAQ